MTNFTADWLSLREEADARARSSRLTALLARHIGGGHELGAVDLAAGTGANVRYLMERLPDRQDWLLIDHDAALLSDVPVQMRAWGTARGYSVEARGEETVLQGGHIRCRLTTRFLDLRSAVGEERGGLLLGRSLLTASALLDLVSEPWLRALARQCREEGAAVLIALTYDGRIECSPTDPDDHVIRDLVNEHQRTDKGFGPALGPTAPDVAERCFANLGYRVERDRTDWVLAPDTPELQSRLIEGWAGAAVAIDPVHRSLIEGWRRRRLDQVAARGSHLLVGHEDLAAWPFK
jgi:hypothetical protein